MTEYPEIEQGSNEWLKLRKDYLTASNAPNMMGDGYDSRDKAMRYALGIEVKEITPHLQALFDAGHGAEAAAVPIAIKYLNEDLEPLVATIEFDGLQLLASFDGIDHERNLVWEHKNTNKVFAEIPPLYYWQLEHQMLVADCVHSVLTITSRDDGSVTHYEYESHPERREALINGWKKWLIDLENYERSDSEWLDLASDYRDIKFSMDSLAKQEKDIKAKLQLLAGSHSSMGGGVKVSVSEQWVQKQTAAAYIKEHEIKLPEKQLENAKINYRITINKAA